MAEARAAFELAAEAAKDLKDASRDDQLRIYGLFKQANKGNCSTARPGFTDPKGRMKWDAWNERKGLGADDAMREYIKLVRELGGNVGGEESANEDQGEEPFENATTPANHAARAIGSAQETTPTVMSAVSKRGTLLKQQMYRKGWPERLFELNGETLQYSYPNQSTAAHVYKLLPSSTVNIRTIGQFRCLRLQVYKVTSPASSLSPSSPYASAETVAAPEIMYLRPDGEDEEELQAWQLALSSSIAGVQVAYTQTLLDSSPTHRALQAHSGSGGAGSDWGGENESGGESPVRKQLWSPQSPQNPKGGGGGSSSSSSSGSGGSSSSSGGSSSSSSSSASSDSGGSRGSDLQRVYDIRSGWAAQAPAVQALQQAREHREGGKDVLFVIRRSTNRNIVVYSGQVGSGVEVKWIMFEKKGDPTEELTYLEKNTAYGTTVKRADCGADMAHVKEQYEVVLSALKDRVITVRLEEPTAENSVRKSRWRASTTIGGVTDVELQAVYVCMAKSSMVPTVAYVELYGVDGYELIEKSRGSGTTAREERTASLLAMRERAGRLQTSGGSGSGSGAGAASEGAVAEAADADASTPEAGPAVQVVSSTTPTAPTAGAKAAAAAGAEAGAQAKGVVRAAVGVETASKAATEAHLEKEEQRELKMTLLAVAAAVIVAGILPSLYLLSPAEGEKSKMSSWIFWWIWCICVYLCGLFGGSWALSL